MPPEFRVVLVDTTDQRRSPLAAGLLHQQVELHSAPITVASAGFVVEPNPPHPHVVSVLRDRGVDASEMRSCRVASSLIREADLILGMTTKHVQALEAEFPEVQERAFTFRHFAQEAVLRRPEQSIESWVEDIAFAQPDPGLYLGNGADVDVLVPADQSRHGFEYLADDLGGIVNWMVSCANL